MPDSLLTWMGTITDENRLRKVRDAFIPAGDACRGSLVATPSSASQGKRASTLEMSWRVADNVKIALALSMATPPLESLSLVDWRKQTMWSSCHGNPSPGSVGSPLSRNKSRPPPHSSQAAASDRGMRPSIKRGWKYLSISDSSFTGKSGPNTRPKLTMRKSICNLCWDSPSLHRVEAQSGRSNAASSLSALAATVERHGHCNRRSAATSAQSSSVMAAACDVAEPRGAPRPGGAPRGNKARKSFRPLKATCILTSSGAPVVFRHPTLATRSTSALMDPTMQPMFWRTFAPCKRTAARNWLVDAACAAGTVAFEASM
mmetsp:Transcript_6754/g.16776  ORF Transcript_6754/g.16776 Transcript_6754/m.16776 type:complete len:317 (+) Transcript_6754:235-1185(+)